MVRYEFSTLGLFDIYKNKSFENHLSLKYHAKVYTLSPNVAFWISVFEILVVVNLSNP